MSARVPDFKFTIKNNILIGEEKPFINKNKNNVGQELLDTLTENGDKIAQIHAKSKTERTFNEMKDLSIRCALWLKTQGVGVGDIVTVCSRIQLDAYICNLAIIYVGATINPWDDNLKIKDARNFMRLMEPKIIFANESSAGILVEAAKLENFSTKIIILGKYPGLESLASILSKQTNEEVKTFKPQVVDNPEETAIILFSSGTSGLPKAIKLQYDTVLQNMYEISDISKVKALHYCKPCWIGGIFISFKCLLTGSTFIIHDAFDVEETYQIIEQYKVDWTLLTPFMIATSCKANAFEKYNLKSLKTIITAGSTLNPECHKVIKKSLPHVSLVIRYGLSELGGIAASTTNKCKALTSVGYVTSNKLVNVIDLTTGKTLGPNESGEVCIKSPTMMSGYYKNPTATKEAIDEEGWLHTGDLGYYNDDGEIFITDRLKQMIRFRGYTLTSTEIEQLLMSHPAVLEAAVVTIPHPIDDEHPMAFVKKNPNMEVTESELIQLSSTLGDHYKLRGGVKFLDEIPRTNTGKICKSDLKNMAKLMNDIK